MSRCSRTIALAALSMAWGGLSASADTLRCQSVNGNLNCVGSNGVSCQTIDGRKVCISGHGDVVQSFGNSQKALDDLFRTLPRMDPQQKRASEPDVRPDWPSDEDE